MIIGAISENKYLEKRISITPEIAKKYIKNGFQILLEVGYGSHLGISDDEFVNEGISEICKIIIENKHYESKKANLIPNIFEWKLRIVK